MTQGVAVVSELLKDGGWKSRKMAFAACAVVLGSVLGFWMPVPTLTLVLDFISTIVFVVVGGNVGTKALAAWSARGTQAAPPKALPPPLPKSPVVKKASEDDE